MSYIQRRFAAIGMRYNPADEQMSMVIVPATLRVIVKDSQGWTAQRWGSELWESFSELIDAAEAATPKECRGRAQF